MYKAFNTPGLLVVAVATLVAGLAGSCANYRLGAPTGARATSVYIAPARNESMAPQAAALVTENVVRELLQDGRIRIVGEEEADTRLEIEIVDYDREAESVAQSDTGRASSFDLTLAAQVSLLDVESGDVLIGEQLLVADTQVLAEDGLVQAEYDAMPRLARELAIKVRDLLSARWN